MGSNYQRLLTAQVYSSFSTVTTAKCEGPDDTWWEKMIRGVRIIKLLSNALWNDINVTGGRVKLTNLKSTPAFGERF